jgi:hypothetical protein
MSKALLWCRLSRRPSGWLGSGLERRARAERGTAERQPCTGCSRLAEMADDAFGRVRGRLPACGGRQRVPMSHMATLLLLKTFFSGKRYGDLGVETGQKQHLRI